MYIYITLGRRRMINLRSILLWFFCPRVPTKCVMQHKITITKTLIILILHIMRGTDVR